jgi:D-alanyl-lipoteichoic acid acyltransferase DltB (MBOAT superfamily)
MRFTSLAFLIFASGFFLLWPLLRARAPRRVVHGALVAASCVFYGWFDWRWVILLLAIGGLDFFAALAIGRARRPKLVLVAAIVGNLVVLGTFKYLDFLIGSLDYGLDAAGMAPLAPVGLVLPIGLSFYTFQGLAYVIDVYRRDVEPSREPLLFLAFLSLFPSITAGPIARANHLLPQLDKLPPTTEPQRWHGTQLIAIGVFKKMLVADRLAEVVNLHYNGMGMIDTQSAALWWFVAVAYAVQLYCDFSGYSDIARGLGLWMGIEIPVNFDRPFRSTSIREYWNRWHISLSTWFRDYVFFPLSRRWRSRPGFYAAIIITFGLSGLWHGAAWTFVLWGVLHGLLLSIERMTKWDRLLNRSAPGRIVSTLIVFVVICLTLVVFRSRSVAQMITIFSTMFSTQAFDHDFVTLGGPPDYLLWPAVFVVGYVLLWFGCDRWGWVGRVSRSSLVAKLAPLGVGILLFLSIYMRAPAGSFLYARF